MTDPQTVLCPIAGKLALDRSGTTERCCAIEPYEGHLYAPFSGRVVDVSEPCNSLRLLSDDGIELLIRIGGDTVEPDDNYFSAYCKAGDIVKEGDLLIDFDLDALLKDGIDTLTTVSIVNCEAVEMVAEGKIRVGDRLLKLVRKAAENPGQP